MPKGEWGANSRTARVCKITAQHVLNDSSLAWTTVLPLMVMYVGWKAFGVFLALFREVMGMWWVWMQLRKTLY